MVVSSNEQIQEISALRLPQLAAVYAEVFAGQPWLEVSRCNKCGNFSSSSPDHSSNCSQNGCDGVCDQEAYPLIETTRYIQNELQKPDAIGLYAVQLALMGQAADVIKGFAWGYGSQPDVLAQQKYHTQEMQKVVADLLVASGFFFYVSEVGVPTVHQGNGLGKRLTNQLIDGGIQKGLSTVVLRTNEDSPMRYIAEKVGMKPVVGLDSGVRDTENEARVLFVGKR